MIKFNQKAWLKPLIDINTRRKVKNNFQKYFFKLKNCAAFGKTTKNMTKHRDIKLAATEARRNCLVSEPK